MITGYNFWMRRISSLTLFTLLLLTFILVPSEKVFSRPGLFSANPTADGFIETLNTLRQANGLEPYLQNPILMAIAQRHADYIASTGVLTHFDKEGKRPFERAVAAGYPVGGDLALGGFFAESIYSGSGVSDVDILAAWQKNEADSLAVLSPDFKDVGVGIAAANGITYYVLNAGSEEGLASSPSPTVISLTVTPGTVVPNTPLPNGEVYHIVRKSEALWSIAIAYGTTIAELKLLNSLASDEIFEGQKLLIRRASTETPTATQIPITVTLGIPTSTATQPVTPTSTNTPTPLPTAPTSIANGGAVVGGITLAALFAAGIGSFLAARRRNPEKSTD